MIDFTQLRILVVENNRHVRRLFREMLLAYGVRTILESNNALDAYSQMLTRQVDIIILDFFLGKMDGGDFARMLRQDAACINRMTPILLVTGLPEHNRIAKARDGGVDEILAKPVSPRQLYTRIHAMISNPRPFVISDAYTGPCRRRRMVNYPPSLDRREAPPDSLIIRGPQRVPASVA